MFGSIIAGLAVGSLAKAYAAGAALSMAAYVCVKNGK